MLFNTLAGRSPGAATMRGILAVSSILLLAGLRLQADDRTYDNAVLEPALEVRFYNFDTNVFYSNLKFQMPLTNGTPFLLLREFFRTNGVDLSPPATFFINDRTGELLVHAKPETLKKIAPILTKLNSNEGAAAGEDEFYHRFLSLVDTNKTWQSGATNALLIDPSNKTPKLTNHPVSLQNLTGKGEVGSIRLGMTMNDVVIRWGKPIRLEPRCDDGTRLSFTDCALVFQDNCLNKVRFRDTAVFDQGLSAKSNFKAWRQVLGEPTLRHGHTVLYESHGTISTVLFLSFFDDDEPIFPPTIYLDPPLTNWFKEAPR
jgi:hypothetical protein